MRQKNAGNRDASVDCKPPEKDTAGRGLWSRREDAPVCRCALCAPLLWPFGLASGTAHVPGVSAICSLEMGPVTGKLEVKGCHRC